MKRILTAFLAALLLLQSSALLSSCGNESYEEETETPTDTESETEPGSSHSTAHAVPKQDFDGENFNSLCFENGLYYFTDEEAAGDPIKEALWKRTELIKDYLNCNITHTNRESIECIYVSQMMYDQIMAQSDDYQQILMHTIYGVSSLVNNGYAYDFAELPNVDLEAEWWDLDDMESLRVGRIYAYGRSDFMISSPHIVVFNKTMIENLNLENPYDLVDSMTWTVDKMLSIAKNAIHDADNDNVYSPFTDTFGIAAPELSVFNSFLMSCEQPVSRRNDEGRLEMAINTEKTVKIIEKFYDYNSMGGSIYIALNHSSGLSQVDIFSEGRAMFALASPILLESLRDKDIDAGIVPYPMYDEAQSAYYSMDWGPTWAITATIGNPELVGSVVELYSYFSKDTIVPAYYDKVLEGKLTNDNDSRRMLELIFESVSFDPVNNYFGFHDGIGELAFVIGRLVIEKSSKNFASFYRERQNAANKVIDDYYKSLEKNGRL